MENYTGDSRRNIKEAKRIKDTKKIPAYTKSGLSFLKTITTNENLKIYHSPIFSKPYFFNRS